MVRTRMLMTVALICTFIFVGNVRAARLLSFVDKQRGWMVGFDSDVYHTEDGGECPEWACADCGAALVVGAVPAVVAALSPLIRPSSPPRTNHTPLRTILRRPECRRASLLVATTELRRLQNSPPPLASHLCSCRFRGCKNEAKTYSIKYF